MLDEEDPGDRLISAVCEGRLKEVAELIHTSGFTCSKDFPESYYLLCDAIENKHSAVAKLILTKSSRVNIRSDDHDTPLHLAVENDDVKLVKILLKKGADVDIENENKQTPFQNAIKDEKMKIIKLFLYHKKPNTPLHFAVRIGNIKIVEWLLYKGGVDINAKNRYGETPLQYAISNNQMEIIELLLKRKANVHKRNKYGSSSLHIAVEQGSLCIVKRLLKAGARINSVSKVENKEGYTPLCIAAFKGHDEIAAFLLSKGAKVNVKVDAGETALYIAAGKGHLEIVEDLIKHGADVNSKCRVGKSDCCSFTPLWRAIWHKQERAVKLLLKYGANVNSKFDYDVTIIATAVESQKPIIVSHILDYGPDMNEKDNKDVFDIAVSIFKNIEVTEVLLRYGVPMPPDIFIHFEEFRDCAVPKGCFKIVEEFLKHGANANDFLHSAVIHKQEEVVKVLISYSTDVNVRDKKERTPLFYATENGELKIIELLLSKGARVNDDPNLLITAIKNERTETRQKIIKLLLSSGANVNSDTVLHAAVEKGYTKIIEMLLDYNADINSTMYDYETPLHISARKGTAIITKMLLSRGAEINAQKEDRRTALYIAADGGHKEVVEVLLRCGAEIYVGFQTPLHAAVEHNYPKIVELLLKFGANIDSVGRDGRTALHIASKRGHRNIVIDLLKHSCDINIHEYPTPLECAEVAVKEYFNIHLNDYSRRYPCYYTTPIMNGIRECRDIVKILKCHIVMMRTANFYLNASLLSIANGDELGDIQNKCKKEIEYMKSEKITNTNVSYYDIFTKDTKRSAMYARNENIVRVIESDDIKTKFPTYAYMIESNFRKGKIRKQLLEQSNTCFLILFNDMPDLPSDCTEKIFRYLSDEDLKNLISTFGRKELLEQGYRLFYFLSKDFPEFSCDCIEKIFSYLENDDLRILIKACKPTNRNP